ncbi:MAG: hypothetical protein QM765_15585 [Myxococcales bacterium]
MSPRVLVADDSKLSRRVVSDGLGAEPGVDVVGLGGRSTSVGKGARP